MSSRKLALVLAGCTCAVLVVMIGWTAIAGVSQEMHEWYRPPAEYAAGLLEHPAALRVLFGLDIAFLVLYTAFFAALADCLKQLGRPLVTLALVAMVGTALLDIVEDHRILASLAMAEHGTPIDDATIAFQQILSSTKFSISYLSLVLFGLAIPRTTRLGWALSLFLIIGTLATGVLGFAAPPAWHAQLDSGRWIGFLLGFVLAGAWLRQQPSQS